MAQSAVEVPVRKGRALPFFFMYDVCALLLVTALMLPDAFSATHPWMVWVTLYYMNVAYSLLTLPFLLLGLPFLSTILSQAFATGYDKAGMCGGLLTPQQIQEVRSLEGKHTLAVVGAAADTGRALTNVTGAVTTTVGDKIKGAGKQVLAPLVRTSSAAGDNFARAHKHVLGPFKSHSLNCLPSKAKPRGEGEEGLASSQRTTML